MPPETSRPDFAPDSAGQLPELDWQAFRYLAGEMSAAESQMFETRLADELATGDLSASEALVRMTQQLDVLAEAIPSSAALETRVAASQPLGRGRQAVRARWSILATTMAGLVVALGLWWSESSRPAASAEAVVSVWADLNEDEGANTDFVARVELSGGLDPAEDSVENPAAELAVPGWLLAAVSQDGSPENPADERSPRLED